MRQKNLVFTLAVMLSLVFVLSGCNSSTDEQLKIKSNKEILLTEEVLSLPSEVYHAEALSKIEKTSAPYINKENKLGYLYSTVEFLDGFYYETTFFTAAEKKTEEGTDWKVKECEWSEGIDFTSLAGEGLYNVFLDSEKHYMYAMIFKYVGMEGKEKRNVEDYEYDLLRIDLDVNVVEYITFDEFYGYNYVPGGQKVSPLYQFCAQDGTGVFLFVDGTMVVFDFDKGKELCTLPTSSTSFAIDENFVYVYINNKIIRYEKNSGEMDGETEVPEKFEGESKLALGTEGQLYLLTHDGIYVQYSVNEKFTKILDGTKYEEMRKKDNYIQNFLAWNDSEFVVTYWSGKDDEGEEITCRYSLEGKK